MSADLIEWLTAVLEEDARVAREACERRDDEGDRWMAGVQDGRPMVLGPLLHVIPSTVTAPDQGDVAAHIARHDPQSVLARVEGERALIAYFTPRLTTLGAIATTPLRALAYGYRHRPGWQSAWRPDGVEATTDA